MKTYQCLMIGGLLLTSCASPRERGPTLPFHIAIAPIRIEESQDAPRIENGSPTDASLAFDDSKVIEEAMLDAFDRSFVRVSHLNGEDRSVVTNANAAGADLVIRTSLRFHPLMHYELNNDAWVNGLLFAIGGPFCWFGNDNSYYFQAEISAEVFDLTAATPSARDRDAGLDEDSRILQLDRPLTETTLDFMDRADGALPYAASIIIPAFLLSRDSEHVAAQVQRRIAAALSDELARSLGEREQELTRRLVGFYPRDVRIEREGDSSFLVGEFVLDPRVASSLFPMRYRFDSGEFTDLAWTEVTPESGVQASKARRFHTFRLPLNNTDSDTVQLELEQSNEIRRTFTYSTRARRGEDR